MRFFLFALFACAVAGSAQNVTTNLVTPTKTPTAEAPAFGTASYFRKVFVQPSPHIELKPPVRLSDYIVGDRLELSLKDYLELVLANNTDVAIQRLSIETVRNDVLRGYSIFDPTFFSSFNTTRANTPASDILAGAAVPSTLRQPFSLRAQQQLPTGTIWSLGFDTVKFSTNSRYATFNPSINSSLSFQLQQPLLRNRGMHLVKLPITIARRRTQQADYSIRDQVLRLVGTAEQAYWDVIFARENLKVQEQNLALNDQLLKRAQRELELGAISQLEIYQPQAQYANAEIAVTQARYSLQVVEDALRRQMGADLDPKIRTLPITLTEQVSPPTQTALDKESLVEKAIRQRPDLMAARQQMDIDDLGIEVANNALKPDFRLTAGYTSAGLGGNYYPNPNAVGAIGAVAVPTNGFLPGGLGDAFGQLFGFNYPTYAMGLQLNLPLRDRRASADYADAVVNKRLNLLRLRRSEQLARQEVLNTITQVENSRASVELAKVQLDFAQKRLEGDQKRYDLGVITLFFLLDAQTALNRAQSDLVNQAVNYRRNITNLLRSTGDLLQERGIATQ